MEWKIGIDTIAHKTAIIEKGKTIAVISCGFNNISKKENINMYYEIIESGGLVVSEYALDEKTKPAHFGEINRIVSGISIGVLVIEANYRSGTIAAARLAEEQDKKIFAIPYAIDKVHSVGTNKLIQQGAIPTTDIKDIINEFGFLNNKDIH